MRTDRRCNALLGTCFDEWLQILSLESNCIVDQLQPQWDHLCDAWPERMWLLSADLGSGKQINCGRAATTMGAGAEQEGPGALLRLNQLVRRWFHPLLRLHRWHHPRLGCWPYLGSPHA